MPTMQEVRAKFPQYDDMSDADLAAALRSKFYADMPEDEFNARIGLTSAPASTAPAAPAAPPGGDPGALGTSVMSGGNALLLGWGDEVGAALGTPIEAAIGAYNGEDSGKSIMERIYDGYSRGLRKREDLMAYAEGQHPLASTVGTVAGSVTAGGALARGGLSAAANAAQRGAGLARVAGGSAVDGGALGLIAGAGEGSGAEERFSNAGYGALTGLALGGATPLALAGVGAATAPVRNIVTSRIMPQRFANDALATAMRRSGVDADTVAQRLTDATADGQGVFTVADALGNSGQRMLSTVTRTPNDARQEVVEQLLARQAGQGRRVSNALAEGFGAPDTAAQRSAALTAQRANDAAANYGAARADARAVDPSGAINAADDFLRPGAARLLPETNIADDSIEAAVRRARGYLTDGNSVLTDFNAAFRAKVEMDNMIDNARPAMARELARVRNALDDALADASDDYANARNTYRAQSRGIDAVPEGTQAARAGRSEDTIAAFNRMTPAEQEGFRAGYADQLIREVQGAPIGNNKVRSLQTDAAADEFPVFATPGRGEQLGRRIDREATMFQTQNQALGGSRTADNLADMEDMANFDPALISRLLNRDFIGAGLQALTRAVNEAQGLPPRVVEQVGRSLMETNPAAARQLLQAAQTRSINNQGRRAVVLSVLNNLNVPAAAQATAP